MFIVFNKQKIYSYLIALGTVIALFVIAITATTNINTNTQNTVQTSGNIQNIE